MFREDQGIPDAVLACLPLRWRQACARVPVPDQRRVHELRLRVGAPVGLVLGSGRHEWLGPSGFVHVRGAPLFTKDDAEHFFHAISDNSIYALEEQLRQGFVTLPGGHRVGFSGEVVMSGGGPRSVRHVGSFLVRISRGVIGCGRQVVPALMDGLHHLHSTLVVSPPGCGKTTLLRDVARLISCGVPDIGLRPRQVGIADERSEIAASYLGVPQHDLGPRVDVVDKAPKALAVMQLLRGMAPEVIVTDEIGRGEDALAVQEALHAGVVVLASAHGRSWHDVARRPTLAPLFEPIAFGRVVVLSKRRGPGTIEAIVDPRLREPNGISRASPP